MLLIVFGCDVQSAIVDVGVLLFQYMYVFVELLLSVLLGC